MIVYKKKHLLIQSRYVVEIKTDKLVSIINSCYLKCSTLCNNYTIYFKILDYIFNYLSNKNKDNMVKIYFKNIILTQLYECKCTCYFFKLLKQLKMLIVSEIINNNLK